MSNLFPFNTVVDILSNTLRHEKEIKCIQIRGGVSVTPRTYDNLCRKTCGDYPQRNSIKIKESVSKAVKIYKNSLYFYMLAENSWKLKFKTKQYHL